TAEPEEQTNLAEVEPVAAAPVSPAEVMISEPDKLDMADQKLPQLPASTPELEKEIISSADSKPLQSEAEQKTAPVPVITAEPEEQTNLAEVEPVAAFRADGSEAADSSRLPILTAQELVDTKIDIRNGNGVSRMALDTRFSLCLEGFNVISSDNHIDFGVQETVLYYSPGKERVVQILNSKFFQASKAEQCLDLPEGVDIKIILGHDLADQESFLAKLDWESRLLTILNFDSQKQIAPSPAKSIELAAKSETNDQAIPHLEKQLIPSEQSLRLPLLSSQELIETAIDLRNGNGIKNMARNTRTRLSLEGFNVVSIANHIDFGADKTLIYYRPGKDRVVEFLTSKFFPVARAEESLNLPRWADIKIILGHDLSPQDRFLAQLAK
ncbi:MAG: LytR C-terminal domain-containing protein, partial [Desulfobacteraceae bacterium]